MTKLQSIIIFIISFCLVTGYKHFYNSHEDLLSKEQVSDDIDLLIKTLDETYAGKEADPENFQFLISELTKIKNQRLTPYDLYKKIQSALNKFPDGHLTARLDDANSCSTRSPASISPEDEARFEEMTINQKKTLILKIPTFLVADKLAQQIIVDSLAEKMKTADSLILDLRGNTGGYPNWVFQIGAVLWGQTFREDAFIQYFHMPVAKYRAWDNRAVQALHFNRHKIDYTFSPEYITVAESNLADPDTEFADYSVEDRNMYLNEEMEIEKEGFAKPIYILVDKACASACELMLDSLEMHPFAVSIGNQTVGAIKYGNAGVFTLPSSDVDVYISTSYVDYVDNRNTERKGYKPKIFLAEGEDAMKKAISLVK